jgi:glutathione S-transferase
MRTRPIDGAPMHALPVLYSFRRCPYAMRARLALASSGLAYELREVVLRSKPVELLAASPKGTVPVLVLPGGEVIDESLDVMLWALRQHDPDGWLAGDVDGMLALIAANDGTFKQHLDRYKYPNRYTTEHSGDAQRFGESHRAAGAEWLNSLQHRLHEQNFLFGDRASLADMAVLPFVRQFAHTDAAWFAAQPWPQLAAWLARFEAGALYQSVMDKHAPWLAAA